MIMAKKIIVLDGGHGGKDAGTVYGKLYEKDIVLKVVKLIEVELKKYANATVKLTRSNDVYLTLSERARRANDLKADAFVSVHVNAGGGTGFETFKYPNSAGKLQKSVHAAMQDVLTKYKLGDRGKKEKDLAVVRETKMEATLTELAFIDTTEDRKLLENETFLKDMAVAHAKGIADYLRLKKKVTPAKAKTKDYKIKTGDTLYSISRDHKVTVNEIYNINAGLKKKDVIYAGEVIKIPVK